MGLIKFYKNRFLIFLITCVAVVSLSYIFTIFAVPGDITLLEGEEYVYNFKSPFLVNIKTDKNGIIKLNDGEIKTNGSYLQLSNPISFKTEKNGIVNLKMRLFGILPLRTMRIDILSNRKVVACGNTVGVKLKIDGVLVIGISDVETSDNIRVLPTKESGIRPGDMLVKVNDKKLDSIDQLINEINENGDNAIRVRYRSGSIYSEIDIKPVKAMDDKKYHIGLWVRDSTAGIGTLTFYDPESECFGALGHGITDIDTGTLMPVESGEILEANILGIRKGRGGIPGELKGIFSEDKSSLGIISMNNEYGIYGRLSDGAFDKISYKLFPIGLRSQIKEGSAKILANIDGKKVEEYEIEIQKVSRQSLNGSKGMVIRVTDKRLLEETGGIVQGMSGSPIIQDEKIIGAVTHVLVNDPTRGYGIFIEGMLKNAVQIDKMDIGRTG